MNFYHLVILDASGSMCCIRQQALSGCNETIQSIQALQRQQPDEHHFLSLVTFDSVNPNNVLFDKMPIEQAELLKEEDYEPNACTPLYDCIGMTCTHLKATAPKKEQNNFIVTIITDGLENSSREYNAKKIKMLIDELKPQGWTFALIGANIDEVLEGDKIGIHNSMAFAQTDEGTQKMFNEMNKCRVAFCMNVVESPMSFNERDTAFFKKRPKPTKRK